MTVVLLVALCWPVMALAVALGLGQVIRLADRREMLGCGDLSRELDSVLAGREDDLRAAAGPQTA
ncbi:hypothetical protein ACI8AA_14890 [Geodermatophilus sp. SYSU D01180]